MYGSSGKIKRKLFGFGRKVFPCPLINDLTKYMKDEKETVDTYSNKRVDRV